MSTRTTIGSSSKVIVLVEGALCVALSVVFSYFKLFSMPQGGSITLEMAPLFYFAYRCGWRWGILAGGVSGLLQMLFGGYIAHPIQAILDYPLAFACMGIAGIFVKNLKQIICGTIAASALRLLCHVLSGVIFFSSYAPDGQNPWVYSFVYNASFMVPSLIISGVIALFLWRKFPNSAA
ncbi:MAG: energy-coupled thiamine transporter ThiT [Synergistaceae bacterium]|jgi:thiamine transporter|nr:energy-coupled thiamine transporter ThiT [Synergistaceae bacterium]